MLPLFAITIFLGAVLVFGVQPIAARMLLPSFGGSPAVWSATSVFFQLALLAGYGYSFLLTRHLAPRRQPVVHLLVLAAPIPFLPLAIPAFTDASSLPPALLVIGALALTLGIPFTVAATTGPLLQRWFSYTGHPSASDPYFLYAASNAGSLIVLLAYPFVIERSLGLDDQSVAWAIGYGAFVILAFACAAVVLRHAPDASRPPGESIRRDVPSVPWHSRGRWVILTAVPSALSLGATAHISTDLAAVPLLWIAPLSLYLLSYIVAFSQRIRMSSRTMAAWLPLVALPMLVTSTGLVHAPIQLTIVFHLGFLLAAATMCHTRVAEERPAPERLTEYYVWLAVGGALGGIFVSLAAPVLFDAVWEYPIAIGLALMLRASGQGRPSLRLAIGTAGVVLVGLVGGGVASMTDEGQAVSAALFAVAIAAGLLLLAPLRPALAAAAAGLMSVSILAADGTSIHTDRTFFGVYRVNQDEGEIHRLYHGTTLHGLQVRSDGAEAIPGSYYHPTGPVGQVLSTFGAELEEIAVLGLGVGTLAAYGEEGQRYTFYEIDPAMVEIAEDPALFSFVSEADAGVEIIVADGRLGIVGAAQHFDAIILDAFSSDAIPVHLLTTDAIAAYLDRLAPEGLIVANISNRYLDLEPALGRIADALGLRAIVQHDRTISEQAEIDGKASSTWVVMARSEADLGALAADPRWRPARFDASTRPWTDDFSDLLGVLR